MMWTWHQAAEHNRWASPYCCLVVYFICSWKLVGQACSQLISVNQHERWAWENSSAMLIMSEFISTKCFACSYFGTPCLKCCC